MEEQEPRDEVRRPIVRPEDLNEWLSKDDVTAEGITLTIKDVFGGTTRFGFRYKVCTSKGDLTLNKTSLLKIAEAYGTATEGWVGKLIKVKKIQMMVSGKLKDVLMAEPVTQ